jgi:Mitotic-spindle organizing gamma-tubulin ring associated
MDVEVQRRAQAEEQLNTVQALSDILNTGLDRTTLRLLVQLLEAGINPEVMHLPHRMLRFAMSGTHSAERYNMCFILLTGVGKGGDGAAAQGSCTGSKARRGTDGNSAAMRDSKSRQRRRALPYRAAGLRRSAHPTN